MRLALITTVAATSLFAQPEGPRRFGPEGGFMRFHPVLAALDADHDGKLSAGEIQSAGVTLRTLDKNNDGMISEDEARPMRGPGGPGGPGEGAAAPNAEDMVKRLMQFDKNADGKLSKDEVPERMQGIFARGDGNKDGVLTEDELKKMADSQPQAGEGRGGRGPGRAEGRGEGRGEGGPRGGFLRMDRVMSALDANHDGSLSAEELKGASAALAKLDQNGDGQITEDEVRPAFGPGGRRGERRERE